MDNREVALLLQRVAELLILKGDNDYKARAYQQASRVIYRLNERAEDLANEKRLKELKGIGKALAATIEEITMTGKSRLLTELEAEVPVELLALFSLPGVGAKNASVLVKNLAIDNLDDLEKAAREGRVQKLPGMGPALENNILSFLESKRIIVKRSLLSDALSMVSRINEALDEIEGITCYSCAGELRRRVETVGEIKIIVGTNSSFNAINLKGSLEKINFVTDTDLTQSVFTGITFYGIPLIIQSVEENNFAVKLFFNTGSAGHLKDMVQRAADLGFNLSEDGLLKDDKYICVEEENDIYHLLELPFIPPEIREGDGEVNRAVKGEKIELIEKGDIKGDLHLHSDWSDGYSSITELTDYARKKGYRYIAVTDHSQSLKIARGLTVEKLRKQIAYIKDLRRKSRDVFIFTGIEVDILNDGSLDYDDDLLAELDLVIASVHSGFRQSKEQLTQRIVTAMQNPHVNIIGHLSGRLIGKREPYEIDTDQIFALAAKTGTIIEINSSPDRLDAGDNLIKQARRHGVSFAINTDSHGISNMEDILYGVYTARRGALTGKDVINTYELESLIKLLNQKPGYVKQ